MRKFKLVTIPGVRAEDQGARDNGKSFLITEMDAESAEEWAEHLFLTLANAGVDLPGSVFKRGMAGLATVGIGILEKLKWSDVKPLLVPMMACVKYCPNPSQRDPTNAAGAPIAHALLAGDNCQIEEIPTRIMLRKEVLLLHVGFLGGALTQRSDSPTASES